MTEKRVRRVGSFKQELVKKSREASLAAVQVFNNPSITFKSEIYVVLMVIAWTYLMHAYYRDRKIDYRYFKTLSNGRKKFELTGRGTQKYWELERCLNCKDSPLDKDTANNIKFIIALRHEIEHQMTTKIDDLFSARFQACCLNYNDYIKQLFGDANGIDRHLSFSLQFASINKGQIDELSKHTDLPKSILAFIYGFDGNLSVDEFNSPKFSYRVLFIPKLANKKGQEDRVIEFIKPDSELAKNVNIEYALIKDTEKEKFLPGRVVQLMKAEGYGKFSIHHHSELWKKNDAKKISNGYGAEIEGKWYWYEKWIKFVRNNCEINSGKYK